MSTTRPVALPASRFPETDGIPLETPWHRDQINFLVNLTRFHFRERDDFYTGGNMFIYYDPQDPRKNAGPDYFYVTGVDRHKPRQIWAVWEEGDRYPDTIVELMSPTTKHKDRRTNKAIYETVFRTPEYFLYDPDTQELQGWRLVEGVYEPIEPDERGWLWSEQLGLWLGKWEGVAIGERGVWIRFFDPQGRLVLSAEEAERHRAEQERKRAERQRRQTERERQRADAAEAELTRLRALLDEQRGNGNAGS